MCLKLFENSLRAISPRRIVAHNPKALDGYKSPIVVAVLGVKGSVPRESGTAKHTGVAQWQERDA